MASPFLGCESWPSEGKGRTLGENMLLSNINGIWTQVPYVLVFCVVAAN